jgi:hypothetical protein
VRHRHGRRQAGDAAGEQAEAVGGAELLPFVEEDLEADADAEEEGAAVERLVKRRLQRPTQRLAGWREGADAGEQEAALRRDPRGVQGDLTTPPNPLQRAHQVPEVAHAGIDDESAAAHAERVPFVLGTSAAPDRSATACRSARAAALNAASAA